MTSSRSYLLAAVLLAPLAGCTYADETLWPTLAGKDPSGRVSAASPTAAIVSPPGARSGGDLTAELRRLEANLRQRDEALGQIRSEIAESNHAYADRLAALRRMPANDPARAEQAKEADAQLGRSTEAASRLAALGDLVASDAALASYLVQASRATAAQPGTSDAERKSLASIERDASYASADADRLLAEIRSETASRNRNVAADRRNLRTAAAATAPAAIAPAPAAPHADERRPLVTIRFDQPNVAYESDLRYAVGEALKRWPHAGFEIVAVTPPGSAVEGGAAAKRNMEGVLRVLTSMDVPPERLTLSAMTRPDARYQEIRVFVR